MANVQNSFIKSKLNKDLDARLLPNGEYRDAKNVQVSRSEGANVGSLENVLGNKELKSFESLTGEDDMVCIGKLVSDSTSEVYLFLTSNTDPNPSQLQYTPDSKNYIIVYNPSLSTSNSVRILVKGSFLNFSTTHEIYHANLLEDLLFWTDNRNQPRKINVSLANPTGSASPTYYVNEDQISVAKYNPYQPIQLWQKNLTSADPVPYETTMKDVNSKTFPNGATAFTGGTSGGGGGASITLVSLVGEVPVSASPYGAATVGYIAQPGAAITPIEDSSNPPNPVVVNTIVYGAGSTDEWTVTLKDSNGAAFNWPTLTAGTEIVFNYNNYYDKDFAGDENYLEDKFVRFSYRFKFEDNEYSLIAPFTQVAFIPKQDGYFMYVRDDAKNFTSKDDQADAYRSTIVSFVENKVDAIKLIIPLPFPKSTIQDNLKIKELDIIYKESDALALKVIETIETTELTSGADSSIFEYDYLSKKPYKVLPSSDTTRVYDKIPVRAFAQEVAGNRVVYGNFQNKHTPPTTLDYNVTVSAKSDFNLKDGTAVSGSSGSITSGTSITIGTVTGTIQVGSIVTSATNGVTIPSNTSVTGGNLTNAITLDKNVTLVNLANLVFTAVGPDTQAVSKIEYPNHSVKQNRNYQVGVVLSDRYGRSSTVILSRSNNLVADSASGLTFLGDTIYAPYLPVGLEQSSWPGNSIKVLFNSTIGPNGKNVLDGSPGIYNGDTTSADYNPLGWYSYKIVVKQTEQEYYNVYLPGVMAAYPEDTSLEIGITSHAVLINDNINKVPRDLTEVGPDQKQFRSSVQLFGRVENTSTAAGYLSSTGNEQVYDNAGALTNQYYPGRNSDTVSTISTVRDLFDYNPVDPPSPNYFGQFYQLNSNPLIAKISTTKKIGQISNENYKVSSALVNADVDPSTSPYKILLKNVNGFSPVPVGSLISGPGLDDNMTVLSFTEVSGQAYDAELTVTVDEVSTFSPSKPTLKENDRLDFFPGFDDQRAVEKTPGIQYLSVYETEPVESLLDIFWESTSVGEVADLNNLILNATGGGAGLSANLSTSNWSEAYVLNNRIFDANFTLVDAFGSNLLASSIVSVTLNSVSNGNGVNVQTVEASPYFELVGNTQDNTIPVGFFNIILKQDYIDNVYYSQNEGDRNFTFSISWVTTDGLSPPTNTTGGPQIVNAGPSNIRPANASPGITTTPNSLEGSTIISNRYTSLVAVANATNGSSNALLKTEGIAWSLISVSNQTSPNTDLVSQGLFTMTNTVASGLRRGTLTNTSGGSMPASIYNITIGVADAGGPEPVGTNISFILDLRIVPNLVGIGTVTYCLDGTVSNCESGELENSEYVVIQINTGTTSQNGFYIYDIGPSNFQTWANSCFGGNTISINYTGRQTSSNGNSISSCVPAYGTTLSAAQGVLEDRNYSGQASYANTTTPPSLSSYIFEII